MIALRMFLVFYLFILGTVGLAISITVLIYAIKYKFDKQVKV